MQLGVHFFKFRTSFKTFLFEYISITRSNSFTPIKKFVGWLCWGLTSQSTIFQSYRDGAIASWVINQYFRGVKCLAQGHNTAAVGLEPRTSRSGVRHSTTEPPRSPPLRSIGFTVFSNISICISLGNKSDRVVFNKQNIARTAWAEICFFAARNEPLLLNNIPKYLNSLTISRVSLFKTIL